MTKEKQSYSTEFKSEAIQKLADHNGNISATAKQLNIVIIENLD